MLPDGSTSVLQAKPTDSLRSLLATLLSKKSDLSIAAIDVFPLNSDKVRQKLICMPNSHMLTASCAFAYECACQHLTPTYYIVLWLSYTFMYYIVMYHFHVLFYYIGDLENLTTAQK